MPSASMIMVRRDAVLAGPLDVDNGRTRFLGPFFLRGKNIVLRREGAIETRWRARFFDSWSHSILGLLIITQLLYRFIDYL